MNGQAINNLGKVPLLRIDAPWKMEADEKLPTGYEFEEFVSKFERFIEQTFPRDTSVYLGGDFHGERTEAIYFERDEDEITGDHSRAIADWLAHPERRNWRVVIPQQGTAIYENTVISPGNRQT